MLLQGARQGAAPDERHADGNHLSGPPRPWNWRRLAAIVALDAALLAELCLAIFLASRSSEDFTVVFLRRFFVLAIPTVIVGWTLARKLGEEH